MTIPLSEMFTHVRSAESVRKWSMFSLEKT